MLLPSIVVIEVSICTYSSSLINGLYCMDDGCIIFCDTAGCNNGGVQIAREGSGKKRGDGPDRVAEE